MSDGEGDLVDSNPEYNVSRSGYSASPWQHPHSTPRPEEEGTFVAGTQVSLGQSLGGGREAKNNPHAWSVWTQQGNLSSGDSIRLVPAPLLPGVCVWEKSVRSPAAAAALSSCQEKHH